MQCLFRVSSSARRIVLTQQLHTTTAQCEAQNTEKTINQVTLLGRVGADPQKRGSEEHPVINFPLATHFSYKYESGDILQRTDWHRVSVFRPGLRDTVYKYLKKGQRVYVTGKLSYGEIKLDDGQVRTASTVIADDIIFFQSQPQNS
ncbi:single-stranded DNA-binding protein, mitochondrial [Vanessa atalanta]|uniref:single-stranded DNA-binding protein, mitochondrial n=1 Tax=Vanessa atalanta TaxID=42275 RepID=UPI000E774435|nr:single-stranded DNA-binding protein, mitochondrial [Vanessa tameamea]XP_047545818.1 single-stranded DNA-binding protein, mitochondrial [Vanessa atalanta]